MDFSVRKFPREAASDLIQIPWKAVCAYQPVFTPIYVFLPKNEKFVSVKAPFDFFTTEDFEKLKSFETLYSTPFVNTIQPYIQEARRARRILEFQRDSGSDVAPAPYELSDSILRIVGPLWFEGPKLEPYFITVFAQTLCDTAPKELLIDLKNKSVELYDVALQRAALSVFFALHLGANDLIFLNFLQNEILASHLSESNSLKRLPTWNELVQISSKLITSPAAKAIEISSLSSMDSVFARRLANRLERVKAEMIEEGKASQSIFGEKGIIHVG